MRVRRGILLAVLVVASTAAPAQAQWVATPYLGMNIAGDVEEGKGGIGGSAGYFAGRLGFELDLQRHWHFFKDPDIDFVPNCGVVRGQCVDIDTRAWSVMGNAVMPIRIRGAANLRPYGAAGLGLIHAWFTDGSQVYRDQNNFAFNVGGGLMYSLNDSLGLRGDLRYFRALIDEDQREGGFFKDYDFWRMTVGVTFGVPP